MPGKRNTPMSGKLSAQEVGLLLEQISAGVTGQEPLDEIFRALAEDLTDRRLRAVAQHLAEQLEQGADLAAAVDSLSSILPTHMRRSLVMGAKSGNLSGVLAGLSESELARKRMQRGLRSALAYPLLVLSFLLLVLVSMSLTVVPSFADIYRDFDLDLSYLTLYTLLIADYLPSVFLIFCLFLSVLLCLRFFYQGNRFLHWFRNSLPLFGRAWMWSGQHEFSTLMATLTEQGVPTNEALSCTSESLRDRNLAWAARGVRDRCEGGATLSQCLQESIHFDSALTSLVEWGEVNGTLPAALREAASTFENQMQLYNRFLYRIMPPLMLTLVAIALILMISAMFIPLVELINGLTG